MATNRSARISVTLSHVATEYDLIKMEERIMSALTDAVAGLRQAVETAISRLGNPGDLEGALAAERARYAELVASEEAEDLEQDAALAAARAEVDRLVAEQTGAAGELNDLAARLNSVGTAVNEAPAGTPVEDVEVPDAPADETPAPDAPVDETPAEPAPDAPADETSAPAPVPDGDVDGADVTPVDVPADGGPTDADGNPVTPPAV